MLTGNDPEFGKRLSLGRRSDDDLLEFHFIAIKMKLERIVEECGEGRI